MRHEVKLSKQEKIRIWLDLCDFTYTLMQKALSAKQLAKKMKRLRKLHWEEDKRMLIALGRVDS